MEEYCKIKSGNELIVRKKLARLVEKYFRYLGYDFRHDLFKQIVYSEEMYKTPLEEKMKHYYDAYIYLLNNYKNPFSASLLKRFFYIIFEKEPANDMVLRLTTLFFNSNCEAPFENSVCFLLESYNTMVEIDDEDRLLVSLIFFNYTLAKNDIPIFIFLEKQFKEIKKLIVNKSNDQLLEYMLKVNHNNKLQTKKEYRSLEIVDFSEIYKAFMDDKSLLESYGIKYLFVFGSYSNNEMRIDSDIDLLVVMNQNLTNKEKEDNLKMLSNMYHKKFHHFVDFMEISNYMNDNIIKEITDAKKIF